ncbi:35685_t:CDS:2, partial [Racocetra persica]
MYLDRESNLKNVDKILGRYLDDSNFAGTYIDVKNNSVIIYTVNMNKKNDIISKPDVREYERLLDFRQVRKSLARLKSSFNELATIAKQNKPKGIFTSIQPRFNNIVVIVSRPPGQHSRAFIGTAKRLGADIYSSFHDTAPLTNRGLGKRNRMNKNLRPSTNIRNDQNASYPELTLIDGPPVSSHGDGNFESNLIFIDKMSSVGGESG